MVRTQLERQHRGENLCGEHRDQISKEYPGPGNVFGGSGIFTEYRMCHSIKTSKVKESKIKVKESHRKTSKDKEGHRKSQKVTESNRK